MAQPVSRVKLYNDFELTKRHKMIFPCVPMSIRTKQEAYRAAAWLVYLAWELPEEDPPTSFDAILHKIATHKNDL